MLRTSVSAVFLGSLVAGPLAFSVALGLPPSELGVRIVEGGLSAIGTVGWVLAPQLVLAVAVVGLALERMTSRLAGVGGAAPPVWVDPAVESALLLGMLGTLSGMVSGFAGLSPEELVPGPRVHSLGTALRSSFVGFGIALVGVWAKSPPRAAGAHRPAEVSG